MGSEMCIRDSNEIVSSYYYYYYSLKIQCFIYAFSCKHFAIAGILKSKQLPIATNVYIGHSTKHSVVFTDDHSSTKQEIQPMYLLVGFGVIFSLLLFIFITELVNKKGKKATGLPCEKTKFPSKSLNKVNETQCNTGPWNSNSGRFNQSPEAEYAEINEAVEIRASKHSNAPICARPANAKFNAIGNDSREHGNSHIVVEIP